MFVTAVLLILAGVVITFVGVGVGSRLSRRVRPADGEGVRGTGGLVCGVVVLVGAVTVLLGIADGLFLLVSGG